MNLVLLIWLFKKRHTVIFFDISFFLREETDYIKVSSRSKGDIPVNLICERYFNGGGHKNAAGGEFYGSMDECVKRFEEFLYNNEI